ncbi:hypothetical protein VOLCADRAFT_91528 [Volvox carteri f. nagariensis]|uniref:Uncharacterized protein n=1 Tax=Volvox carteri f. nagariensis TaxID=3068 RepID=D8TXB3_VOLCA|nr:uncharacterized protein VOLCADRAFT_91528 [Volvox carteri f. nagariensis]EFJ47977.1 hypothetical protein VOLCADRAFT_91528 [Volvox carteri f. nagariensis]|eukprot:XP_002951083.1 hypothetical protein VOLCADRAFT_91528 [Volvox carteri f. nagariensis]
MFRFTYETSRSLTDDRTLTIGHCPATLLSNRPFSLLGNCDGGCTPSDDRQVDAVNPQSTPMYQSTVFRGRTEFDRCIGKGRRGAGGETRLGTAAPGSVWGGSSGSDRKWRNAAVDAGGGGGRCGGGRIDSGAGGGGSRCASGGGGGGNGQGDGYRQRRQMASTARPLSRQRVADAQTRPSYPPHDSASAAYGAIPHTKSRPRPGRDRLEVLPGVLQYGFPAPLYGITTAAAAALDISAAAVAFATAAFVAIVSVAAFSGDTQLYSPIPPQAAGTCTAAAAAAAAEISISKAAYCISKATARSAAASGCGKANETAQFVAGEACRALAVLATWVATGGRMEY